MKDYERRFKAWKEFYQSQKRRELVPPEDDEGWTLGSVYKQQHKICQAVEKDLMFICRKYGFTPITEPVEHWDERWRNTGKLPQLVARRLNALIMANRGEIRETRIIGPVGGKALRRKYGPHRRLSTNLAEVIIIGLKLLERSEPGLKHLREFLSTEEVPRTGTDDIRKWKDERMHYFKRLALSAGKKKIIKNFGGCELEKEKLEMRTSKKADDLVKRGLVIATHR